PAGLELYVDAKDIEPEALVGALRGRGLIERSIVYQGADYLARLRAIEPRLRRLPPLKDPAALDDLAARVAPDAVDAKWSIITPELVRRCHDRGIRVYGDALGFYETIPEYRRAIRSGIDVIQTDHPLRVLRALELGPIGEEPARP
ncbi:MAG: glycerophosphodiester phosphodiesterase, partial [Isosphaeraceae bacterium]